MLDAYMGSNPHLINEMPEELVQYLNSTISSQNGGSIRSVTGNLSQSTVSYQNGGSSVWGNLSQSALQMPQQDVPYFSQHSNPANSRASIDESSLITFANSSISRDSYLPSNVGNSTASLPSNFGRMSYPSTRDHFPPQQQTLFGRVSCPSSRDHFPPQQHTFQEGKTYPGLSGTQGVQLSKVPSYPQSMNPAHQAPVTLMNYKRPRLEMSQIDTVHAYSLQQPSPSQVPMQLNCHSSEAAARFLHQQMVNQQQNQTPLLTPPTRRCNMQRLPPPQLTVNNHEVLAGLNTTNGKLCYGRLMCYMHHLNHGPHDNNINHWRKFVDVYYSPVARRRWCMSKYSDIGNLAHGVFTQANMDTWTCDFCQSKLERGFEATYKVLPWLCQKNFEGGLIEELLYVESPVEKMLPSGFMVLWFRKAIQESIYLRARVVHEGQLRIIFTPDSKIISWEFCIQRHEDFISRRLIATQVNELVNYATKCSQENTENVPTKDQLSNIAAAGSIIARNVKQSGVNELGFSLPFARILQVSDVFASMKDLMADMKTSNMSPIEALNRYKSQKEAASANLRQMQTASTADSYYQQANNIVTQTPGANANTNAGEQPAMPMIDPYYLKQVMAIQTSVPSSSVQLPPIDCQINDILACMRAEGTPTDNTRNTPAGKRRLVYDPAIEDPRYAERGGKSKGKLLNYSSSSNSSARFLTDNSLIKKEPESDDDSTSLGQFQEINGSIVFNYQK